MATATTDPLLEEQSAKARARNLLVAKGYNAVRVHRIDEVTESVRWVAFQASEGTGRIVKGLTAIVAGEEGDWRVVRVVNGWAVPGLN